MHENLSDKSEFSIVPFRYKLLPALLTMLQDQKYLEINTVTMKTLPKIGFMALYNGHPIAAGFLRRVEGGYAQLDGLTSNPYFGSKIRHQGIDLIVDTLIQEAKDLDLKGIIAFTKEPSIVTRAQEKGFKVIEETLIALSTR